MYVYLLYSLNVIAHFLLARQLSFSIYYDELLLGTLEPFEWNTIEAVQLTTPPSGARDLVLVSKSSEYSLFVDGLKPFTSEFECSNESQCPINCPESERGANGSLISRRRRALLCINSTSSTHTINFTCSVTCPAWMQASPRIVWIRNGTMVHLLVKHFVFRNIFIFIFNSLKNI